MAKGPCTSLLLFAKEPQTNIEQQSLYCPIRKNVFIFWGALKQIVEYILGPPKSLCKRRHGPLEKVATRFRVGYSLVVFPWGGGGGGGLLYLPNPEPEAGFRV